jgi:hypothetical protein
LDCVLTRKIVVRFWLTSGEAFFYVCVCMKMASFENNPYWRAPYAVSVEILLEQIPFLFDRGKRFLKDPQNDDYVASFVEFY